MKIHREGYIIILVSFLIVGGITLGLYFLLCPWPFIFWPLAVIAAVFFGLIVSFFRVPHRPITKDENIVFCPADGKVVVIEEVEETEYFKDKRIQVSIFMSPLNVHKQWYPMSGKVDYMKYHKGLYLVAWHPKSSTENERSTVVVGNSKGQQILFRQIAGAVARRICCYSKEGDVAEQGEEFGFIKFGSRVDVFLPLGTDIKVELEQKVQGSSTVLAVFQ